MAVKTITITEDAYARLAAQKEEGESFSEVICRMTGSASLFDLVGILSDQEAEAIERHIRERRANMRRRVQHIARELE